MIAGQLLLLYLADESALRKAGREWDGAEEESRVTSQFGVKVHRGLAAAAFAISHLNLMLLLPAFFVPLHHRPPVPVFRPLVKNDLLLMPLCH